ncbi:MAG: hypothetical protein AAF741_08635 [Bacteroidota bacterium]
MLGRIYRLSALSSILLLAACANYQKHTAEPAKPYGSEPPKGALQHQLVFLSDLYADHDRGLTTLESAASLTQESGVKGKMAILGDIVGTKGLRKKDDEEKAWLDQLIVHIENVAGKVYFTPGENELGREGNFSRLQRLEKYFKKNCDKNIDFSPSDACSGPEEDEIFDDVGLIGLNSAWYLADWQQEEELAEGCDHSDRSSFMLAVGDEIRGYRDRVKIVMMHHPLRSNGNRGGRYSVSQHLFPLADVVPGAYVPLPVVGSVARGIQGAVGSRRDISNLLYREMVSKLKTLIDDEENVIFLGGHEHNMLYADRNTYHVVTAGSGSTRAPATGGNRSEFSYGAVGFGELAFYESGQVFVNFYTVDAEGRREQVFSRCIIQDRNAIIPGGESTPPAEVLTEKTVTTAIYTEGEQERSGLYKSAFGRTYRDFYYRDIEAPVLYIDTIHNGLEPFKRGGGMTTMSLHVRGGDGHRYQLRSVRKNAGQLLAGGLERGMVAEVVSDAFTAIYPYAPLTLPPMQEKLGLYNIRPGLFYIPKQEALGNFNAFFGDEMYWLEQRPDDDWSGTGFFGNSKDIVGNGDARQAISDSWKHRADQRNYLRARLFDLWIGDWDRHRDQWRWAKEENEEGITIYTPVARDRDQAYSNFDAFVIKIGAVFAPDARKLQGFDYDYDGGNWLFTNGKWNDRFFLNEMTEEDFMAEAAYIVEQMDDATIDAALQLIPPEVREESLGEYDLDGKLKVRRDLLPDLAMKYYKHLSRRVDVTATNKDDVIVATGQADGNLLVELFDADKDGEADEKYYSRVFDADVTREVRLYGLDGDDRFVLNGEDRSDVKLRVIGGTDDDEVEVNTRMKALAYDDHNGMEINGPIRDRRSRRNPELNLYRFQEYKPDYTIFSPVIGFNVDDGFVIGANMVRRNHGFKPDPFSDQHSITATYSTLGAINLAYDGTYNNMLGRRADILFSGNYVSDEFVVNFFGFGNDTEDMPDGDLDFNRTRQGFTYLYPRLRLRGRTNRISLEIGPYFHSVEIARRTDGFLGQVELPDRVFTNQNFTGVRTNFSFNNLARPTMPDNGVKINLGGQWNTQLDDGFDRDFTRLSGDVSIYRLFGKQFFGVATRIGVEHIDGEFDFFQAPELGGRTNFRAVRSERFLGQTVFYQNVDIRLQTFLFGRNTIPTVGGFILGFDHGRVWFDGEDSDTWHVGYGGGVWFAPLGATILHITYFASDVGNRVSFAAGFPF